MYLWFCARHYYGYIPDNLSGRWKTGSYHSGCEHHALRVMFFPGESGSINCYGSRHGSSDTNAMYACDYRNLDPDETCRSDRREAVSDK